MGALLAGWLLGAAPHFVVEPGLPDGTAQRLTSAWAALEDTWKAAGGPGPVRVRWDVVVSAGELPAGQGGRSVPGRLWLRARPVDATLLRHEVAHQLLFAACGPAAADGLFHEAFALAVSGEADGWGQQAYRSLPEAVAEVERLPLDNPRARAALARLLAESSRPGASLPEVLRRRLAGCEGGRWEKLTARALAALPPFPGGLVVLSRHSGEVLAQEGDVTTPRPFGSTLKPFVLAGAATAPVLPVRPGEESWRVCGPSLPRAMGADEAVARSCNGYFLDWALQAPGVQQLGAWGPTLTALGLVRPPAHMADVLGLTSALGLSPLALAAAYRGLLEARPALAGVLGRTFEVGTLAGLACPPEVLGAKTGTVRDGASEAVGGWLVVVTRDLVLVEARPGLAPRHFAAGTLQRAAQEQRRAGRDGVEVQVFGLVPPGGAEVECPGEGLRLWQGQPTRLAPGERLALPLAAELKLVCLSAPLKARVGEGPWRDYAGVMWGSPAPAYRPAPGLVVSASQRRARQGSGTLFRTTRRLYVGGVLAAEEASLRGEARAALAAVVTHNVDTRERHGARPPCDTTHCMVFLGTRPGRPEDEEAPAEVLVGRGWLPFAAGGTEPWEEVRPRALVEQVLGMSLSRVRRLSGVGAELTVVHTQVEAGVPYEEEVRLPCERVRGPLRLPGCPRQARWDEVRVTFQGEGRGHGLGLDVGWARDSGLSRVDILRRAYGPPP